MPQPPIWKTYAERCHPQVRRLVRGGIELDIEWDGSWGSAYGVALVPLMPSLHDANQLVLQVGNNGVRRPVESQVNMDFKEFFPRPTQPRATTPLLTWPVGAPRAVLFLLFQSPNPHHPNRNILERMKSGFRSFLGMKAAIIPPTLLPLPSESEIKEAIASYLRDVAIDSKSEGVLQP